MSNQISLQIKRGGGVPPYVETTDTEPNSSKSYYTKNGDTYTSFGGSEFVQGTTYYESVLKKFELGFDTTNKTLYINNNGEVIVPFAKVALSSFDSQTANYVLAAPNGSNGTPTFRALVAADIPNLSASKITSGTFDVARIPNLAASKITSGILAIAQGGTGAATVAINTVFAGPSSGSTAAPSFRTLVGADMPETLTKNTTINDGLTLTLLNDQDAEGNAANAVPLIVGGAQTAQHLELDSNEILSKTNGITPGTLNLQDLTGVVSVNGTTNATATRTGAFKVQNGGASVYLDLYVGGNIYGGNIQYKSGDTFTISDRMVTTGFLTEARKNLYISVTLPKTMGNLTPSVTVLKVNSRHSEGGYTFSSGYSSTGIDLINSTTDVGAPYTISVTKSSPNVLFILVKGSSPLNGTNNTPAAIAIESMTITFS